MTVPTGSVSEKYESGGRGVATVSTGIGDAGGVSYGKHQLASNNGSMQKFLNSKWGAPYKNRFCKETGGVVTPMTPGTSEFTAVYKAICQEKPKEFEANQFGYILETHFDPQVRVLLNSGISLANRHIAVYECVFSVAVQYGPNTNFIVQALGANFKGTDEEFIKRVQAARRDTVNIRFKSSSQKTRDNIVTRSKSEEADLLALLRKV